MVAASLTTGAVPFTLQISAAGSSDPDGDIADYTWDFGDGSRLAHGETVSHVYAQIGTFTVAMTVTDGAGQFDAASLTVEVTEPTCPTFDGGVRTGAVGSQLIQEASGLVASRTNPGVVWVNNDSGDRNRIYALASSGAVLGAYSLVGAQAVDWEDIAIGPGPIDGASYVYVGDIGDNNRGSNIAPVYRFVEPVVPIDQRLAAFDVRDVEQLALQYPNNEAHNAETLLVDPVSGDLYIVTKHPQGASVVFRASAPLSAGVTLLTRVTTLQFPGSRGVEEATGGDVSPSGDLVIIRTYGAAYIWLRLPGVSLDDIWARPTCQVPLRSEPQGEAVSFTADGRGYFTLSEGSSQPLWLFSRTD